MNKILSIVERQPFSAQELLQLVDNKSNLVIYPELANYRSIDELLGKYGACIILYVTKSGPSETYGHWTCIFRVNKYTLEFFDPYAYYPDSQLKFTDKKYPPFLTELIMSSSYNVIYNIYELQDRKNKSMSTCGRHCGMRLNFRVLPIKQYAKMMLSVTKGLDPDDLVTLMTAYIK